MNPTELKKLTDEAYFKDGLMSDMRLRTIKNAHAAGFKRGMEIMEERLVLAFEHERLEGTEIIPDVCFCSCKNQEVIKTVFGVRDICNNCRKYVR